MVRMLLKTHSRSWPFKRVNISSVPDSDEGIMIRQITSTGFERKSRIEEVQHTRQLEADGQDRRSRLCKIIYKSVARDWSVSQPSRVPEFVNS
jgi:hypothetical protein